MRAVISMCSFIYLCRLVTFVWLEVVVGNLLEVDVEELVVGISMYVELLLLGTGPLVGFKVVEGISM